MGANHAQGLALIIPRDSDASGEHPFPGVVLAQDAVLITVHRSDAVEMVLPVALHLQYVVQVRSTIQRVRAVADFVFLKSINFFTAFREKRVARLHMPVPQAIAGALQRQLPAFLTQCQLALLVVGLGDVFDRALVEQWLALQIAYQVGSFPHPHALARFGPVHLRHKIEHIALGVQQMIEIGLPTGVNVPVQSILVQGIHQLLFRTEAVNFDERCVHAQNFARRAGSVGSYG